MNPCELGPVDHIADLVKRHDSDRFLACLLAPSEHRDALLLLSAFHHEIARAREVVSQPMLALIRLQWWRETVLGARRHHHVAGPLGEAIAQSVFDQDELLAMIEAREIEADEGVETLADWHRYLAGSAGGWAVAAGRVLGAKQAELELFRMLGAGYGVAAQLANVAVWARHDRCMLPLDVLDAHGLSREQVMRDPSCVQRVRPILAQEGLTLIHAAKGPIRRSVIAAALPSVLARRDLKRGFRFRGAADKFSVIASVLRGRV